jgi:hypothetical protein
MTQEKYQLDKIIELYNSGIEVNINLAIQQAESIFGISNIELDSISFFRKGERLECRVSQEVVYNSGFNAPVSYGYVNTTINIKSDFALPFFLSKLFNFND